MSIFAQYAPHELARGAWSERREEIGDQVIRHIERFAPDISSCIAHREVLGLLDIEAKIGVNGRTYLPWRLPSRTVVDEQVRAVYRRDPRRVPLQRRVTPGWECHRSQRAKCRDGHFCPIVLDYRGRCAGARAGPW